MLVLSLPMYDSESLMECQLISYLILRNILLVYIMLAKLYNFPVCIAEVFYVGLIIG